MDEKVVEILKNTKKALTIYEIQDGLKINNVDLSPTNNGRPMLLIGSPSLLFSVELFLILTYCSSV